VNTKKNSRRGISELNVTPLIDVVLVLLILFMISAPLMQTGVEVDLPRGAKKALSESMDPVVISLTRKGRLFLDQEALSEIQLVEKLAALAKVRPDTQVILRCDGQHVYARVMRLLSLVQSTGLNRVGLASEGSDVP
jgi:biopolymer transport protein TolR